MDAARSQDDVDLAAVYRDHARAVYGLARRICGPAVAAEVTQEVFLAHWSHPERFDPNRSSLRSFLMTVTNQRAIDALRSESARRRREVATAPGDPPAAPDADQHLVEHERSARLIRAIRELSPLERDAIMSAYYGGRTYREVAQVLDVPLGTVKSRIRSGLMKLRHILGESAPAAEDEAA